MFYLKIEKHHSGSELGRKKHDRATCDLTPGFLERPVTHKRLRKLYGKQKLYERETRGRVSKCLQRRKERKTKSTAEIKGTKRGMRKAESEAARRRTDRKSRVEIGVASAASMLSRRNLREKSDEISFVKSAACRSNRFPLITARHVYSTGTGRSVPHFFSACPFANSTRIRVSRERSWFAGSAVSPAFVTLSDATE